MTDSGKRRQSTVDPQFRDNGKCLERSAGNRPGGAKIGKRPCWKLRYTIGGVRLHSVMANLDGAWLQAFLKRNRQGSLRVNEA